MFRRSVTLSLGIILVCTAAILPPSTVFGADTAPWKKTATFSASMTEVATSRVDQYQNVSGLSGSEESFSWQVNFNGTFKRRYNGLSQEHRIDLLYGEIDGVENNDEIDFSNIGRAELIDPTFAYATARVRSEFDTFGHPTALNLSSGLGSTLLNSESYGTLEVRTGPRLSREWNPHTDWVSLYELIFEYEIDPSETSRFTSQLESYTDLNEPENYTVRWENRLTASLNNWLDLRYTFTLYYEDTVGEVATRSVSTLNLVYHFFQSQEQSQ